MTQSDDMQTSAPQNRNKTRIKRVMWVISAICVSYVVKGCWPVVGTLAQASKSLTYRPTYIYPDCPSWWLSDRQALIFRESDDFDKSSGKTIEAGTYSLIDVPTGRENAMPELNKTAAHLGICKWYQTSLSPNGKWLWEYEDDKGIVGCTLDGAKSFRWLQSKSYKLQPGGAYPVWSADGRSLFLRLLYENMGGKDVCVRAEMYDADRSRVVRTYAIPYEGILNNLAGEGARIQWVGSDGRIIMFRDFEYWQSGDSLTLPVTVISLENGYEPVAQYTWKFPPCDTITRIKISPRGDRIAWVTANWDIGLILHTDARVSLWTARVNGSTLSDISELGYVVHNTENGATTVELNFDWLPDDSHICWGEYPGQNPDKLISAR